MYRASAGEDDMRIVLLLNLILRIRSQRFHDTSQGVLDQILEARRILEANGQQETLAYAESLSLQHTWHKQRFEWAASHEYMHRSLALMQRLYGDERIEVAFDVENLARSYYFAGDFGHALPLFEQTIRIISQFKGDDHLDMDWSLYYLARIKREQGQLNEAQALMARAVKHETHTPQHPDNRYLARALCGHALVLAEMGRAEQARGLCERGRSILQATEQQRIQMDVVHESLGIQALLRGDVQAALVELQALVEVRQREWDPAQTDTPVSLVLLGDAQAAAGDVDSATRSYDEAVALCQARYPANYPSLGRALAGRAALGGANAAKDALWAKEIYSAHDLVEWPHRKI